MKVKCIACDGGWWTVGEMYDTLPAGAGYLLVSDDGEANVASWIATPFDMAEDESVIYAVVGCGFDVKFQEVPEDE